jgi:hypothetical protein
MPTPIVHLCVAKKLLETLDVHDKAAFCLGSISPDAIYLAPTYYDIDGKYDKYTAAHMVRADYGMWRESVLGFISGSRMGKNRDFHLGYGIHILTDIQWKETVFAHYINRCKENGVPHDGIRSLYYDDAERFDLECHERFRLGDDVFPWLSGCGGVGVNGWVTADEVESWRVNTLRLFDGGADKRGSPAHYFTYDMVKGFIRDASATLSRIYSVNLFAYNTPIK